MACPEADGQGSVYDTSTSPWTPVPITGTIPLAVNAFFTPNGFGGVPNSSFFVVKGITPTNVAWRLDTLDYPSDGMYVTDQMPGDAAPFRYPFGTSGQHQNRTAMNVSHFDGRARTLARVDYWPNLHSSISWRYSKMWRPINEGVTKDW